jgi:hypothetical protein
MILLGEKFRFGVVNRVLLFPAIPNLPSLLISEFALTIRIDSILSDIVAAKRDARSPVFCSAAFPVLARTSILADDD